MDQVRFVESMYRIEHRHRDGAWGEMREVESRPHHTAPDHDPERSWGIRRIFRCTSCDESVAIGPAEAGGVEPR